jgi:two-component system sensor histidine kinase CpxA
MRSLFLKVFLWFWVATILSGLALFVIAFATHSGPPAPPRRPPTLEQWRRAAGQTLALYGRGAASILEHDGQKALDEYTGLLERAANIRVLLFRRQQAIVFDRGASEAVRALADRAAESGRDEVGASGGTRLLAVPVLGPGQKRYVVVGGPADAPGGGPPLPPVPEPPSGLFAGLLWFARGLGMRSLVTFIVGGLVCLGLAWHLTAPIRRLRTAAQRLAGGDLTARVGAGPVKGRDEIAALGRDFDLMAARIEALMTGQRQLLRDISHELRSPLARLNVALGLARQRSGPEAGGPLDRIECEAERLNDLIGRLLTLTQLESGGEWIEPGPVSLKGLVESIASDANFEAQTRNRAVHAVVEEEITIRGTEEMLRQGIENVVRNAVRYTAENTQVDISVSRRRAGSGDAAIIRIRDRGPGVPEHALSRLFLPFYRVADARERQTGGTGIGLAITERAVRLHGGTVTAANAADGGLVVEIVLPVAASQPPAGP